MNKFKVGDRVLVSSSRWPAGTVKKVMAGNRYGIHADSRPSISLEIWEEEMVQSMELP